MDTPNAVVNEMVNKFKYGQTVTPTKNNENNEDDHIRKHLLALPYKGNEGMSVIRKYKKILEQHLPNNVQPEVVYNSI